MSKHKDPIEVLLPCDHKIKVTHRRTKQLERPRNHICKDCGKAYTVNMSGDKPVVKSTL